MASNETGTLIGVSKLNGPREIFENLIDAYRWAIEDKNIIHDIFSAYRVIPRALGLKGNELVVPEIEAKTKMLTSGEFVELRINEKTVLVPRHTDYQPQGTLSVATDENSFMDLIFDINKIKPQVYDRDSVWLHIVKPKKPLLHLRLLPLTSLPPISLDELISSYHNVNDKITYDLHKILDYQPSYHL